MDKQVTGLVGLIGFIALLLALTVATAIIVHVGVEAWGLGWNLVG